MTDWANQRIEEIRLGPKVEISEISRGNPCRVVTKVPHGYCNGQFVYIDAEGMYEVDGRFYQLTDVTSKAFTIEGVNSTKYERFISGSVQIMHGMIDDRWRTRHP